MSSMPFFSRGHRAPLPVTLGLVCASGPWTVHATSHLQTPYLLSRDGVALARNSNLAAIQRTANVMADAELAWTAAQEAKAAS